MAREINIELGSDESMASLLESVAAERRSATTTQATTSQRLTSGSPSRNISSSNNSAVRSHRTLRRSARLLEASTPVSAASAASRSTPNLSYPYASTTQSPRISEDFNRYFGSHGIQSDQHPRLVQHIAQKLCESRRVVNQTFVAIEKFYNSLHVGQDSTNASATASGSSSNNITTKQALTPWTCPPHVRSLNVRGKLPHYSDPQEVVILSANHSGTQPETTGSDGADAGSSSSPSKGLTNEKGHGTKLESWLQAAVPKTITSFSISSSSDFGMNGLLLLPESLTTLVTGGALFIAFSQLSNLTRLTMCTELLFTDESLVSALGNLTHLQQFDYTYPCDPVQPAWRDLFRYCSSCELYHRRMATKTYTRKLLMPVLPSQIRQFSFSMDEPRFRHHRIDSYDQNNQHSFDRGDNTRFWLCLWKAGETDVQNTNGSDDVDNCNQDHDHDHENGVDSMQGSMPRSWWPENLTRLDLSRCVVLGSQFDIPSQLKELVIAYPLEPNEIQVEGSDSKLEEDKQWFPESLMSLEVHGAPYHACCEIQDNPSGNVASWMNYTNTMLKRVPRHLEHFIITSFQVPDTEAMNSLQARVGKTLKTWTVKLLCPQQPKKSGHSSLQLYAPIIYVEDDASDDEEEENWWSWMEMDSDDSDLDFYRESPSSRASSRAARRQQSTGSGIGGSGSNYSPGQEEMRHLAESEQYAVTPVMLRNAVKGMTVLEKLEVHVNFQHYRYCRSIWKDRLGLSEPISVDVFGNAAKDSTDLTQDGSNSRSSKDRSSLSSWLPSSKTPTLKKNIHLHDSNDDVLDLVTKYRLMKKRKLSREEQLVQDTLRLTQSIEEKGKSVYRGGATSSSASRFLSSVDIKGKGKKVESSSLEAESLSLDGGWSALELELSEDEDVAANSSSDSIVEHIQSFSKSTGNSDNSNNSKINRKILGHGKVTGCPTTKIVYWNNSCCGRRCLGWIRNHQNH
ncbi:hypothetical protein BGX26_011215 [Mortierella sp. AD094]|nr:hypothetical protein BGX26_011215 [Mortierella sp. AD094]